MANCTKGCLETKMKAVVGKKSRQTDRQTDIGQKNTVFVDSMGLSY